MSKFVLSASSFGSIKKAEDKVNDWFKAGSLEAESVKLYKIVEIYDLRLKFVRRKNGSKK